MTRRATMNVRIGLGAPRDARRFIRSILDDWDDEAFSADALLLVSEVVTVATLQSGSAHATVAVKEDDDVLRVEVSDIHRGFSLAEVESASITHENVRTGPLGGSGLGLNVVDWVAPRWGVDLTKPGKTVWFELDSSAPCRVAVGTGAASA